MVYHINMSTLLALLNYSTEFDGFVGFTFIPIAIMGIFGVIAFSIVATIIVKAIKHSREGGMHHGEVYTSPYARPEAAKPKVVEDTSSYCEYCGAVVSKGKEHCDSCGAARRSK